MNSAQAGRKKSKDKKEKKGKKKEKKSDVRGKIVRYPNAIITNWGGVLLDPEIRDHFQIGNIVRVPLIGFNGGSQAPYFRILQDLGDGKFRGRCEDPYLDPNWSLILNGEERVFSSRHVMEVPLDWPGNANLAKIAKLRPLVRGMTGVMM